MGQNGQLAPWVDEFNAIGTAVLGMILAATPLALWVAWTLSGLIWVAATGAAAGILICVLAHYRSPVAPGSEVVGYARKGEWFDNLTAKLTDAHPMVHHHRERSVREFAMWRREDDAKADGED